MNRIKYYVLTLLLSCIRFFPFPVKTGLFEIGTPNKDSPVLITGNYILTIIRLKYYLKGINAYLLVANSKGINVWCSATGGYFTNHSIISILKTTNVKKLVNHNNLILPQLSATGIEDSVIRDKTDWEPIWGPVNIKNLPEFLEDRKKGIVNPLHRSVTFTFFEQIEMAILWAFPMTLILGILSFLLFPEGFYHTIFLAWFISLMFFFSFPFYSNYLNKKEKIIFLDKGLTIIQFLFTLLTIFLLVCLSYILEGDLSWNLLFPLSLISILLILIISFDVMGSTPTYKSGTHEENRMKITLNLEECLGVGTCVEVCPKACLEMIKNNKEVKIINSDACVQCGACIVQCPHDALFFKSETGKIIEPSIIRKFKLNMMGKRIRN